MKNQQDDTLFGVLAQDTQKNKKVCVIKSWVNQFADCNVNYLTVVDTSGKVYNSPMENFTVIEGE